MPVPLSQRDIDAISRVVTSEVGGTPARDFSAHVKAVVDTMMNRAENNFSNYGGIQGQLNAPLQFSRVSGDKNAVGSWDKLPAAPQKVQDAVRARLGEIFATGATQPFLNFANPFTSSPSNVRKWVGPMMANPDTVRIGDPATHVVHYYGNDPTSSARPPAKVYADFARNALYPGMAADTIDRNAAADEMARQIATKADFRQPSPGPIAPELGPPPSNMNLVGFPDAPSSSGPSETVQAARQRLAQMQRDNASGFDPTASPSAITPGNVAMPAWADAEFARVDRSPLNNGMGLSYDPLSSVAPPAPGALRPSAPTLAGLGPTALPSLPSYFGAAFAPGALTPQSSPSLPSFPEASRAFQEALHPAFAAHPAQAPQAGAGISGNVSGRVALGLPSLSSGPDLASAPPRAPISFSGSATGGLGVNSTAFGSLGPSLISSSGSVGGGLGGGGSASGVVSLHPSIGASGGASGGVSSLPLAQGSGAYSTPALAPGPTYQSTTTYHNVPNPALAAAQQQLADARRAAANFSVTPESDYRATPISVSGSVTGGVGIGASAAGSADVSAAVQAALHHLQSLAPTISQPITKRYLVPAAPVVAPVAPRAPQAAPAFITPANRSGNAFLNAGMQYLGNAPSGAGQYTNGLSINGTKQVFSGGAPSNAFGGMGYGNLF